jgi:hypothetical protein
MHDLQFNPPLQKSCLAWNTLKQESAHSAALQFVATENRLPFSPWDHFQHKQHIFPGALPFSFVSSYDCFKGMCFKEAFVRRTEWRFTNRWRWWYFWSVGFNGDFYCISSANWVTDLVLGAADDVWIVNCHNMWCHMLHSCFPSLPLNRAVVSGLAGA